jgi:hypothetical protein
MPQHHAELLSALTVILMDASLLPRERYMEELEDAFRRGLSHKLESGRPYDELARQSVSREAFEAFGRKQAAAPLADPSKHPTREHEQLSWQSGPGPTYSRAKAEEMLRNRYELMPQTLRYSLPRLLGEPAFRALIGRLRSEGWLDWQIGMAVFARIHNLRMRAAGISAGHLQDPAIYRRLNELVYEPERPSWPTPSADLFTYDDLVTQRQLNMMKLPEYWGLELRQETPDFPAIEHLLAERYAYWTDDIDHDDPFPQVTNQPTQRKPAQKKPRARRS